MAGIDSDGGEAPRFDPRLPVAEAALETVVRSEASEATDMLSSDASGMGAELGSGWGLFNL